MLTKKINRLYLRLLPCFLVTIMFFSSGAGVSHSADSGYPDDIRAGVPENGNSLNLARFSDALSESIRRFITDDLSQSNDQIDHEFLQSAKDLRKFYQNRNYTPAWIHTKVPIWIYSNVMPWWHTDRPLRVSPDHSAMIGAPIPVSDKSSVLGQNGFALLAYIRDVSNHGMTPDDYHLDLLEGFINRTWLFMPIDTLYLMKLDVLLSDAFLTLGLQLYYGRVDTEKQVNRWKLERKKPDLQIARRLEEALAVNDVPGVLNMLAPGYRSYWMMKEDLAFYMGLQDTPWPSISSDITIHPGESGRLIPQVRTRLVNLGYGLPDTTSLEYDPILEEQVKLFQRDWGLNADGEIGDGTFQALNENPQSLINRIRVNMERFRWLPLREPHKYLTVNIVNFRLDFIDGADTLISMRAIVGKDSRETPIFNSLMTYLVFSPTWTVPPTILRNDVIPELRKGPGYLLDKDMKLLRYNGSEVDYNTVDWARLSAGNFPYMVRQSPGPGNALGKVKFMFPNTYNIYIHDTPSRGYFARDDRAMSSGCIRVEKPFDLASILLADVPGWSPEKIRSAMDQRTEQIVNLKVPVEVLILYLTAWTDGNGRIQFRNDIYSRDVWVLDALDQGRASVN